MKVCYSDIRNGLPAALQLPLRRWPASLACCFIFIFSSSATIRRVLHLTKIQINAARRTPRSVSLPDRHSSCNRVAGLWRSRITGTPLTFLHIRISKTALRRRRHQCRVPSSKLAKPVNPRTIRARLPIHHRPSPPPTTTILLPTTNSPNRIAHLPPAATGPCPSRVCEHSIRPSTSSRWLQTCRPLLPWQDHTTTAQAVNCHRRAIIMSPLIPICAMHSRPPTSVL